MIPRKELTKTVRSTRTYRFKIGNNQIDDKFSYAQKIKKIYFNYGLKYLYQHYGSKKLDVIFPTGNKRKYLINCMVEFSRRKCSERNFELKKADYNVQSIAKMYEELCVAFEKYRKGQFKIKNYWSNKQKEIYLEKHRCSLSGYMRINYKRSQDNIRSIKFKQNKNQLHLENNYVVRLPYFKRVAVKESLSSLKDKQIQEICIIKRPNGDYELQIIVKFQKSKNISKKQVDSIVGLDVNLANDDFFITSDNNIITWTDKVAKKYQRLDKRNRLLQTYLNAHNYGNDSSRNVREARKIQTKIRRKMTNIIDNWQLSVAKQLVKKYPVLAMERLNSFEMRLSKRYKKDFLSKNNNNKLAKLQPSTFRTQMEYVYENNGGLLLEVNSIDTSKTCHECNYINHDLEIGKKKWTCPNCKKELNRDLNATYNIRDWAVEPEKHAVMRQLDKYSFLNKKDLVNIF